ncbi:hypothetical protein TCAL_10821 [Tigriopus californicus]|uniref:Enhancer of mRNA-decapping protein 4 WD40 repeat region domain-containing protein n=1 Tax=Tigriopus californicus TaxID=6832 RepID=A0A553NCK2_TIGCA|nr:uncharacterized protein LOC131887727 [Tigriopus californicus]TRY63167.1 hypothetical protein TCAL_10821 [Tigriopus californicus]|eukprot:TCALIF_10821-PA protein Name:"Similar to edc4 Enhancer of mRNA-decapping protein 4 (Danio rerio)" AED:0.00 eAED:0.00 QI:94/1/1/1/1/1/2/427/774
MANYCGRTSSEDAPIKSYRARLARVNASETSSSISSSSPPMYPACARGPTHKSALTMTLPTTLNLSQISHTNKFIQVPAEAPISEPGKLLRKIIWESEIPPPTDGFVPFVAVHAHGEYVAFTQTRGPSGISAELGEDLREVVCLYHCASQRKGDYRHVKGGIVDMAFAHLSHRILLGILNDIGEVVIGEIGPRSESSGSLHLDLVLQINPSFEILAPITHRRMAWTPFIIDEDEPAGTEVARALIVAVASNSVVDIFNLSEPLELLKRQVVLDTELVQYRIRINLNCVATRLKISPDASAVVVATVKRELKFYIFDFDQPIGQQLECPYPCPKIGEDSAVISSLWFPDDHAFTQTTALFWKHIVLAYDLNSKVCLYSCDTWQLIQSIKFPTVSGGFHMTMATSGDRFVLFSPEHSKLYVVHLEITIKGEESEAWFSSVRVIEMPVRFKIIIVAPNSTMSNTKVLGFYGNALEMGIIPHGIKNKKSKYVTFEGYDTGSELKIKAPKRNQDLQAVKPKEKSPQLSAVIGQEWNRDTVTGTATEDLPQKPVEQATKRTSKTTKREALFYDFSDTLRGTITEEVQKSALALSSSIKELVEMFFKDQEKILNVAVERNIEPFTQKIVEVSAASTKKDETIVSQFRGLLAKGLDSQALRLLLEYPHLAIRGVLEMELFKKLQKRELDNDSDLLLKLCLTLVKDFAIFPTVLTELFEEVAVVANRGGGLKSQDDHHRVLFEILDTSDRFLLDNPNFHKEREMRRMQMVVKSVLNHQVLKNC